MTTNQEHLKQLANARNKRYRIKNKDKIKSHRDTKKEQKAKTDKALYVTKNTDVKNRTSKYAKDTNRPTVANSIAKGTYKTQWSLSEQETLIEEYYKGTKQKDIALILDRTLEAISRKIKRLNLPNENKGNI